MQMVQRCDGVYPYLEFVIQSCPAAIRSPNAIQARASWKGKR